MKALNTLYTSKKLLAEWINENNLNEGERCLVRIHTTSMGENESVQLAREIKERLPQASICGASVSGLIYNGEIHDNGTLISISQLEFGSVKTEIIPRNNMDGDEVANAITRCTEKFPASLAIIIFGYVEWNITQIMQKLAVEIPEVPFVGGTSGYQNADGSTSFFVFDENGSKTNAIIMSLISKECVLAYTNIVTGHMPISQTFTITSTSDEYIETIEEQHAVKWLNKKLGLNEFTENADMYGDSDTDILVHFPLVLEGGASMARFTYYDASTDRINLYFSKLYAGQKFRVGYLSPLQNAERWQEICSDLQTTPAESIFCYSCLFRKTFSNKIAEWEMNPFKKNGICGAFMLGEVGTKNGVAQHTNGACVVFTLSEKENYIKPDLTAFNSIDPIIGVNDKLLKQIELVQNAMKEDSDNTIFDSLMHYENHVKNQIVTKQFEEFHTTTRFLQDQAVNSDKQICLITIENMDKHLMFLGQTKFNKMVQENIDHIIKFIKSEYPDYTFRFYSYDISSFFFTIKENIDDDKFTDILRGLYANCGAENLLDGTVACINNFTFTLTGMPIQKLVELATDENKQEGQRRFNLCDETHSQKNDLKDEFKLVTQLNTIIKEKAIVPYFQGIYDNRNNCFFCYEALMRLQSPDGKMLFPNEFMEISKKYHLYLPLSLCMVTKILDIFADRTEIITINISAYDVLSQEFQDAVFDKLDSMKNPEHFIFELVETEKFEDLELLRKFIHRIRKYGIKIAADDFGSGYSNFIELGNLEFDYLKINGSLTQLLGTDSSYNQILEGITYMGQKMEVELIAEFVETASMQKQLVKSGVHYSQGYLFSKPMSLDELNVVSKENEINKEQAKKDKSISADQFFENNKKIKNQIKLLYWGGVCIGLLTALFIFVFSEFNKSEINRVSDTFLTEIATGLADKVSLFVEDSKMVMEITSAAFENHNGDDEFMLQQVEVIAETSTFNNIYISFDGEQARSGDAVLEADMSQIYGVAEGDEVVIIAPVIEQDTGEEIMIFASSIYADGEKIGEAYGKYYLDEIDDLLALKTFGGEAFYHLCHIDGTPLHLSGSNDNLFKDGDMYTFMGSLDIYNGHTTESIWIDMHNEETVLINYRINNQERSAVLVRVPYTDWCVVSIVLSDVNTDMIERVVIGTEIFTFALVVVYISYFVANLIFASNTRKELVRALESSYSLTNTLQMSIETDSLTRTYSRATAVEKITDAIMNMNKKDTIHALVVLDVDNFKEINDTYGHKTGDIYLQDFVSAVRAALRAGDILGRMGGDEFIILLKDVGDTQNAKRVMEQIISNVNSIVIRGVSLDNVSVSAGVIITPEYGTEYESLNHNADKALYAAKKAGKNKYIIYSGDL